MGQLGIRAALALSTTNLSYDAASYILDELRANGFNSNTPDRIWVRMMPKSSYTLKVFDYDSANIANIETSIESKVKNIVGKNDRKNPEYYANILRSLLFKEGKDNRLEMVTTDPEPTLVVQSGRGQLVRTAIPLLPMPSAVIRKEVISSEV